MCIEKRLNSILITHRELIEIAEEIHNLPESSKYFAGQAVLLAKKFKKKPDKAMAIDLRLKALSEIINHKVLPGWAVPMHTDDYQMVSESVWYAAANQPLMLDRDKAYFDHHQFIDCVLSVAKSECII